MKVLQVIPNIGTGGAERFVVDLSNELSMRDSVSLVTLYNSEMGEVFRRELNGSVVNYSLNKKIGFDLLMIKRLYDLINRVKPDVIHNHLRSLNYLLVLVPFLKKIPIVHTIHNDAFKECPSTLQRKIRRFFYKYGNVCPVTISNDGQRSFNMAYNDVESHLIINGRMPVAPSPLISNVYEEVNRYKRNESDRVFVHVGRMEPQKNQILLVNAFKKLVGENANAILLIIGGSRQSNASEEILKNLKNAESSCSRIYLLGEKANATDYLYAADFFCLSSIFEGMPISLIEAFATGAVPICTPVGGIPEMIKDLDISLLAKSCSELDYYKALQNAYKLSSAEKKHLARKAQSLYNTKYSIEMCTASYMQLYKELITRN